MSTPTAETGTGGLSTARLEALSDGVLAIVITLLSLDFLEAKEQLVALRTASNHEVFLAIVGLWPHVLGYTLSFLLIGVYWITHHVMFHQIRHTTRALLWLNIAFLMTVAFLPFPTGLLAECVGHESNMMVAFYGFSHFLVSVTLWALWAYASRGAAAIRSEADGICQRHLSRVSLAAPTLYLLGIAASFLSVPLAFMVYLLVPALYIAPGVLDRLLPPSTPAPSYTDHERPTSAASPRDAATSFSSTLSA